LTVAAVTTLVCVPVRANPNPAFLLWYDIGVAVRKWSVSVDETLADRVEQYVGGRGLSSFVARAVANELEREALGRYLDELDSEFGAVPADLVEKFDKMWP